MRTERLPAALKTRVPERMKAALQEIANERHLELSDIAREAFREYLTNPKNQVSKPDNQAVAA